jgi:hypothetical protein
MVSGHSLEASREDNYAEPILQQGKCSRSSSHYVDDTAFILLSAQEVIAASKLIVSHFRRFGLTIHTGSKRKSEDSKTEAIPPRTESSAADMEDIEIDADRFILIKFKCLGSYFVPELNDTADITERISQARKLFGSMNKQLLGNKRYRSISVAGSIKRLL